MLICHPQNGMWYEVTGTTMNQIATELGLDRTTGWCFKVNGVVRKTLGTVTEDDIVELVDDVETVQQTEVSATGGSE